MSNAEWDGDTVAANRKQEAGRQRKERMRGIERDPLATHTGFLAQKGK